MSPVRAFFAYMDYPMDIINFNGQDFGSNIINSNPVQLQSETIKRKLTEALYNLKYEKDAEPSEGNTASTLRQANLLQGYRTVSVYNGAKAEPIQQLNTMIKDGYTLIDMFTVNHTTQFTLRNESLDKADKKLISEHLQQEKEAHRAKIKELEQICIGLKSQYEDALEQERLDAIPEEERLFNELLGGMNG